MQILKLSFTLVILLAIDPMCQRDKNESRRPVLRPGGCTWNLTEYCGAGKKVLRSIKFKSQLRKKQIYLPQTDISAEVGFRSRFLRHCHFLFFFSSCFQK